MTQQLQSALAPRLTISCDLASRDAQASDSPILIGRDANSDLRINHPMISRTHVRVQTDADGHWTLADSGSRNGVFIDGLRRESAVIDNGMTIKLGDPTDGIEIRFTLAKIDRDGLTDNLGTAQHKGQPADEQDGIDDDGTTDPAIAAAGAAVRERRKELSISQRGWAARGIINASTLIQFEKGRSWPRASTQEKLEEELRWPRGTIERIRRSYWSSADPDGVTTTLTDTNGETVLVQAIVTGVDSIEAGIASLPSPNDPDFATRAASLSANLSQLEKLAGKAALDPQTTPTTALTLSKIRRLTGQLVALVAQSPTATLGQRLRAARRRADLTEAETAAAAQVPAESIEAIEAGENVPAEAAAKIAAFIALLDQG
jgi:pSer/pThr/pTyr-binding forkhead associated (FHA) protein